MDPGTPRAIMLRATIWNGGGDVRPRSHGLPAPTPAPKAAHLGHLDDGPQVHIEGPGGGRAGGRTPVRDGSCRCGGQRCPTPRGAHSRVDRLLGDLQEGMQYCHAGVVHQQVHGAHAAQRPLGGLPVSQVHAHGLHARALADRVGWGAELPVQGTDVALGLGGGQGLGAGDISAHPGDGSGVPQGPAAFLRLRIPGC